MLEPLWFLFHIPASMCNSLRGFSKCFQKVHFIEGLCYLSLPSSVGTCIGTFTLQSGESRQREDCSLYEGLDYFLLTLGFRSNNFNEIALKNSDEFSTFLGNSSHAPALMLRDSPFPQRVSCLQNSNQLWLFSADPKLNESVDYDVEGVNRVSSAE